MQLTIILIYKKGALSKLLAANKTKARGTNLSQKMLADLVQLALIQLHWLFHTISQPTPRTHPS
jgi:hypothetical protein